MISAGLTRTIILTSKNASEDCLYPQIKAAVDDIEKGYHLKLVQHGPDNMQDRRFPMPESPQRLGGMAMQLTEQERIRLEIQKSTFHMVKIGNSTNMNIKLTIDSSERDPSLYTYTKFSRDFRQRAHMHFTDKDKYGLIIFTCE